MKTPKEFLPLLEPLAALQRLVNRFDKCGVLIGGVASSLLGKPRFTADIDALFLLSLKDIPLFIERAKDEGFEPRIRDAKDFAIKNRVLLLVHSESETNLDVSLGVLPFEEEVVKRSKTIQLENISLRLPTPEDLIIMKAVAHRPQDLLDIQTLIENNRNIDKSRIEQWVKEFANVLEASEIWDNIVKFLE